MKLIIFTIALLFSSQTFSKYSFSGRIEGYYFEDLNICSQFGDESKLISTTKTNVTGEFYYSFAENKFGLYRIYLNNQNYFDIIFYKENIEIITKAENPQLNMIIVKSEENKQYYEYLINDIELDYKIEILNQLFEIYPKNDFRKKIEKELDMERKNKIKNIEKAIKINPKSFTGRYMVFFKEMSIPPNKYNTVQKLEYIKNEYWINYKMTDLELLNSNAYNNVVINYLKLLRPQTPDKYYEATKTILNNISLGEPQIFAFVFEYILSGFEVMELYEPATKLSLEFGNICKDDEKDNNLNLRIKNNIELSINKKAPDFSCSTITGKNFSLSEMTSKYTLIIFWATWCEHCNVMLSELLKKEYIFKNSNIDIITISIDTNEENLIKYINNNNITFKTICDFNGWKGKIVLDYAIFATPSMYIIDMDLNIISKPINEEKLFREIEKLSKK